MEPFEDLARQCWQALDWPHGWPGDGLALTGEGGLASAFPVTDLAAAAVAAAGLSVAALVADACGRQAPRVEVDRRLCSFWFQGALRPIGWTLPAPWDPIAGDYACSDGWIRLHTNAPLHRAAAERVLGAHADRQAMAKAVAPWRKTELEAAVVAAGGCAAEMRSAAAWCEHPQGRAVLAEPLIDLQGGAAASVAAPPPAWRCTAPERPLLGLRVLDLTRVLAGPVASRFLAGYGADVLRIDPPVWEEPGVVAEVNPGKRCARLDLRSAGNRSTFAALLSTADVLLHGLRPGALEGLGFGAAERARLAPGLVDVCLNAYGWSGPWARRRGFDSLVQMSAGIAEAGMRWRGADDKPVPLPAQALDHATGYLMAAVAVRGIARRCAGGTTAPSARLSLARTAQWLRSAPGDDDANGFAAGLAAETPADLAPQIEATAWGPARRLKPPLAIEGAPLRWDIPAHALGADAAVWPAREGAGNR